MATKGKNLSKEQSVPLNNPKKLKIGVVIPCYRVSENINKVLKKIPKFIDNIYIIDDNCPEKSYLKVKKKKIITL